jgi:membrane protein implicated in regulation of membrane protease activity
MTPLTRDEIIVACEEYWLATRVPPGVVAEMRTELASHLDEATAAGKKPRRVVGRDLTAFAEAWASEYRVRPPNDPPVAPRDRTRRMKWDLLDGFGWVLPLTAIVVLIIVFGPKEDPVDDLLLWRWLWIGVALFLAVGEMITAGFFMLPFAVGAAVAAALAWFRVDIAYQLIAFIGTSLLALWGIRRFAISDNQPSYPVGAKRFMNARAVVIEDIDKATGAGRVRLDREEWRATTDGTAVIKAGTDVKVVDVRGSRLVVEPDALSGGSP